MRHPFPTCKISAKPRLSGFPQIPHLLVLVPSITCPVKLITTTRCTLTLVNTYKSRTGYYNIYCRFVQHTPTAGKMAHSSLNSPYSIHHGPLSCPHLAKAKREAPAAIQHLQEAYRTCARYSLSWRSRWQLSIGKQNTKVSKIYHELDEEEERVARRKEGVPEQEIHNELTKKRKRTMNSLERELSFIERVCIFPWEKVQLNATDSPQLPFPRCNVCGDTSSIGRLHCCLMCVNLSCKHSGHIQTHLESENHGYGEARV